MLEFLNNIDTWLLLLINGWHNDYFDHFMITFSTVKVWIPMYAAFLIPVVIKYKYKSIWIILAVVLTIVLADQLASGVIKNVVQRLRPSRDPALDGLVHIVNNYRSGKYGFVSSHAANSFAFALMTSYIMRKRFYTIAIFLWAVVNSYSRMYLGVHYPFDILGGMVVGLSVAYGIYFLLKKYRKSLFDTEMSDQQVRIPVVVLALSVISIAVYAMQV
ncbi:MAG: phosphatase PAP2 family protein [Paludibacter sp.]|nr:phosphatase PAP2 family protein [Paludibacter sp.]